MKKEDDDDSKDDSDKGDRKKRNFSKNIEKRNKYYKSKNLKHLSTQNKFNNETKTKKSECSLENGNL